MSHSRGAKHGRSQEPYDHFKSSESTRHAKKKTSDGRKNIASIGVRSCSLISHMQLRGKERQRYENNNTLGVNGQGPRPGPMKKRAEYPQAVNKVLCVRKQVWNTNP